MIESYAVYRYENVINVLTATQKTTAQIKQFIIRSDIDTRLS